METTTDSDSTVTTVSKSTSDKKLLKSAASKSSKIKSATSSKALEKALDSGDLASHHGTKRRGSSDLDSVNSLNLSSNKKTESPSNTSGLLPRKRHKSNDSLFDTEEGSTANSCNKLKVNKDSKSGAKVGKYCLSIRSSTQRKFFHRIHMESPKNRVFLACFLNEKLFI